MISERRSRKERVGRVVSVRATKTVSVAVERLMKHSLYGKVIKRSKVIKAYDEKGECREGNLVMVAEVRPFSSLKRWRVIKILEGTD